MEKDIKLASLGEISDPVAFEKHCGNLLIAAGFRDVHVTQAAGDFGVDILATNGSESVAVQCKLYSDPVGVHAVQEVVSGRMYYHCDKSAVITNSTFTQQAIALAKSTDTLLWDKRQLMEWELNYVSLLKNQSSASSQEPLSFTESEVNSALSLAIQTAIENKSISVSMLQRKLQLGYALSAHVVEIMERKGLISPAIDGQPRKVLITRQQWLKMNNNK